MLRQTVWSDQLSQCNQINTYIEIPEQRPAITTSFEMRSAIDRTFERPSVITICFHSISPSCQVFCSLKDVFWIKLFCIIVVFLNLKLVHLFILIKKYIILLYDIEFVSFLLRLVPCFYVVKIQNRLIRN